MSATDMDIDIDIAAVAADVAARPDLWSAHVRHDPERRTFRELAVRPDCTVWLICWMAGHDTGFHDHDGSGGAVAVITGEVREERLVLGGPPAGRVVGAGSVFGFGASDIHRVVHHGVAPAITVHAYYPALRRMGAYVADAEGRLSRRVVDETVELRAGASAAAAAA